MPRPSAEQVADEIKALRKIKKLVPKIGIFKSNNHNMISAQYQTLKNKFTLKEIKAAWPDGDDEEGAAEDALYWMERGTIPSPSEIWTMYISKHPLPV